MNTKDVATKIQALMSEGKTLEEALAEVMIKTQSHVTKDTITYESLEKNEDVIDLRRKLKISYAKKSKSQKNEAAVKRYTEEIRLIGNRLNELIFTINSSKCPWKTALKYNEPADAILGRLLKDIEADIDVKLKKIKEEKGLTNVVLRGSFFNFSNQPPVDILETYVNGIDDDNKLRLLGCYKSRCEVKDNRCLAINQKLRFIEAMTQKQSA